ncbi:MAG: hypothetical protein IT376_15690 [Polyangiaceae bacterium]|nr:hypothetical protein [Polyangiaceae bacterium]
MAGAGRRILPYPWASLGRASRLEARRLPEARAWIDRAVHLERVADALGSVVAGEPRIEVRRVRVASEGPHALSLPLRLGTADGAARFVVAPSASLAALLVARALGRRVPLVGAATAADPSIEGALAAVVLEIARRAGGEVPLVLLGADTRIGYPVAHLSLTVGVDGSPHDADVVVELATRPTAGLPAGRPLAELEVPLSVGVVAAIATSDAAELASLAPGAAWMPGEGWLGGADGTGTVWLATPRGARALRATLHADGRVEPSRELVELPWATDDVRAAATGAGADREPRARGAPIVRVELGAVSLPAADWARLAAGEPPREPLRAEGAPLLRVGGRALARGELVRLGGELAVRIVAREDESAEPASAGA